MDITGLFHVQSADLENSLSPTLIAAQVILSAALSLPHRGYFVHGDKHINWNLFQLNGNVLSQIRPLLKFADSARSI